MTRHGALFLTLLVAGCSLWGFSGCGRDTKTFNASRAAAPNQSQHGIATNLSPIIKSSTAPDSSVLTLAQTRGQEDRSDRSDSALAQPSPVATPPAELTESVQDTLPLPLAALGVNPDLKLTPEQLNIMAAIGDEFIADTAAPEHADASKNITKEEAVAQWQAAQAINDERFRAFFGDEAFNAQQVFRAQVEHDQLVQHTSSDLSK